jgi:hypothetical protein
MNLPFTGFRKTLLTLSLTTALATPVALAQSIDFQKTSFDYIRLPLRPLPAGTKTYSAQTVLTYVETLKQDKADREAATTAEKERAAKALADYKKQSLGEKMANKMLLGEGKPTGPVMAADPYIPQVPDAPTITNTYVSLAGYDKVATGGDVQITILLDAFTTGSVEERTTSYSTTDMKTQMSQYHYEMNYKRPVRLKLTAKDGAVLFDEELPELSSFKVAATTKYKDKGELEKYWLKNQKAFMRQYDDESLKESMLAVSKLLSEKFGRARMTRKTEIAVVSDKKINYDEYGPAYEKAIMGYQLLADPTRTADATKEIQDALVLWNKAIAEGDPKDKKARINAKVMAVTLLNAAEANVWTNNFMDAERMLAKLKLLDFSRYDNEAKSIADLMHDQRERFNANKTN